MLFNLVMMCVYVYHTNCVCMKFIPVTSIKRSAFCFNLEIKCVLFNLVMCAYVYHTNCVYEVHSCDLYKKEVHSASIWR